MTKFILNNQSLYNEIDAIIPVPAHKKRADQRGIDQVLLLGKNISKNLNLKLEKNNLQRIRYTALQTDLSKEGRIKNVINAFIIKNTKKISKKSVILIDDLFTTGSTVNECARVLINSGAKNVRVLTLARGDSIL